MRTVVLTGATSGIGLAAAALLAEPSTHLILHGTRPAATVEAALGSLRERAGEFHYLSADFGDLASVRALAGAIEQFVPIDVLINNAGIPGPPEQRQSAQGVELTFQVNYLGGALLTDLLLPGMPAGGRIVNTASATHYSARLDLDDLDYMHHRYSAYDAYARSKLAVVTASRSFAQRIPQSMISVHPGVIATKLLRSMFGSGGASPDRGGANLVAAVDADVPSGTYLDERMPASPNPLADDPRFQARLREVTSTLLGRELL